MTHKGKVPIIDDALFDKLERQGRLSGANTPRSKAQTPAGSAVATPAGSGDEASRVASGAATPESASASLKKKKKLTRNQLKAQAERRKARQLHWLRYVSDHFRYEVLTGSAVLVVQSLRIPTVIRNMVTIKRPLQVGAVNWLTLNDCIDGKGWIPCL